MAGTFGRKRSLARISFHRPDHNQLLHRLLSPRLETSFEKKTDNRPIIAPVEQWHDAPLAAQTKKIPANTVEEKRRKTEKSGVPVINGELLALIPDELFDECDFSQLGRLCHQAYGYKVGRTLRINEEYSDNNLVLSQLKQKDNSICPPLLILQESWQPPIQEILRFLSELRLHCDEETHIIVALIGKPNPDTLFTKVSKTDLHIWQQKTATLLDHCLQLSPLVLE
jgi:hypothetical protein